MSRGTVLKMNKEIISLQKYTPTEFSRKPRSSDDTAKYPEGKSGMLANRDMKLSIFEPYIVEVIRSVGTGIGSSTW